MDSQTIENSILIALAQDPEIFKPWGDSQMSADAQIKEQILTRIHYLIWAKSQIQKEFNKSGVIQ